jgi:hypothetical protein
MSVLHRFNEACKKNKLVLISAVSLGSALLPCSAFADVITSTDYQTVLEGATSAITVSSVATIIAYIVGAGIGFVFFWFGARKAVSSFMAAVTRGKIKF